MSDVLRLDDINIELISNILDDAAFGVKLDDDGDLYVTGSGIEFPVWVAFPDGQEAIKIFTYASMKQNVSLEDALGFVNNANISVAMPQFGILGDIESGLKMYGFYYLPVEFGVDKRALIATVRRFSSAFKYAANLDENDHFFD